MRVGTALELLGEMSLGWGILGLVAIGCLASPNMRKRAREFAVGTLSGGMKAARGLGGVGASVREGMAGMWAEAQAVETAPAEAPAGG